MGVIAAEVHAIEEKAAEHARAWLAGLDSALHQNVGATMAGFEQLGGLVAHLLIGHGPKLGEAVGHLIAARNIILDAVGGALGGAGHGEGADQAPAEIEPQAPVQPAASTLPPSPVTVPDAAPAPAAPVATVDTAPAAPADVPTVDPEADVDGALADAVPAAPVPGRDHPVDADPADSAPALVPGRDHPVDFAPEG